MIPSIIVILSAFYWLLRETDYLRVRLLVGSDIPPIIIERISWDVCQSRYSRLKLSCGVEEPLCGWDWLMNNTHPIPQAIFDLNTGGVRYHFNIKDTVILKDVLLATKYNKPKSNGHLHFTRNKLGGLVAPLPPKVRG